MLAQVAQRRRPLALALLLALVYQAGACPCGCWDESIWQSLLCDTSCWMSGIGASGDACAEERADLVAHRPFPRDEHATGTALLAAADEHGECEEQARIIGRDGQQPLRDLRVAATGWCGLTSPDLASALSHRLTFRVAENWRPADGRADARAFLQVFRL